METVRDFIFFGSEITADGDCSHEIKRCLLLRKKVTKNLDCIKKQRHHFANKGPSGQSYVFFPVVVYGCESWSVKKAECQRIDAFELWCWRRLLRVPWTARRSNQSILKEISPDWCWRWSSNTFANWCKELTHWKKPWCCERLKSKGKEGNRE